MKNIFVWILLLSGIIYSQTTTVTPLGPEGGIITHLEGSLNDDVVLAVVREHDLYRSVNGGESWEKVNFSQSDTSSIQIYEITFHPKTSDTIFIPTSRGLYRSNDKGLNWYSVQGFPTPKFSMKFVPSIPNVVYGTDENGVLRSLDGGNTWQPMKDGIYFGNRMAFRIAIHPGDNILSSLRLVATTSFGDTVGMFITTNGGTTWNPFNTGLPLGDARKVMEVGMDTTGLGKSHFRVIAGTTDGLYGYQTDQSPQWVPVKSNDVPIQGVMTDGLLVYDKFDTVANEHRFDFFLASNSSLYDGNPKPYTVNNGIFRISSRLNSIITINPFNRPPVTRIFNEVCDVIDLFVPLNVNRQKLYVATTSGIFISTDAGKTWQQKNNGIKSRIIRDVVSLQPLVGTVQTFASVFGGGVYRSPDEGITWIPSNTGLTNPYVTTIVADKKQNLLYAGSSYGIYRSIDAGKTWTILDTPRVVNAARFRNRDNDMTIRISPKNSKFIMYSSPACGLNISVDGGLTWQNRKTPSILDTTHVPENIEFDPVEDSTIYMTGIGIFKSTDLGITWNFNLTGNLPKTGFEALSPTINPTNNKEIFLSLVYSQENGRALNLFKTVNGGTTWNPMTQQIPVYDVQYDRFDTRRLVAAGSGGIFRTTDGGTTWKMISDPTIQFPYYLLGAHVKDAGTYFVGSEQGVHKIQINEQPKLLFDSVYNFGSLLLGKDTTITISLDNTLGVRNVVLQFLGINDTTDFQYLGPAELNIAEGATASFQVHFSPKIGGSHKAILRFATSDPAVSFAQLVLYGHAFERYALEKFNYDFGSVLVGKDSIVVFDIDNQFGLDAIALTYLGNTDTVSFHYEGNKTVVIDTGVVASIPVRFTPKSTGVKEAYMVFKTTDPRFLGVQIRFQGTGVVRNIASRRILLDTSVQFLSSDSSKLFDYYKMFAQSLERADIKVDFQKRISFSQYDAAVYVQPNGPPPPEMIDSLQKYIVNGGTIVALGKYGTQSQSTFNGIFHDSTWKKYNVKTGIQFKNNLIADISLKDSSLSGLVTAYPYNKNVLTYKVDSLVLFAPGSLKIDTSLNNVVPLFIAKSPNLVSIDPLDTTFTPNPIPFAVIAAYSQIGKGKVIAISDYDVWWNGDVDDTTKPYGIFGGNNLRFAFNIFGLIDNLLAHLPEPTPQEAYKLMSIPYSFKDSSVLALFKDLGPPNELVWRMFGRWNDKRGAYGEFPKDFQMIRRGEGYWLITKQPTTINFGTTEVQGTEEDFEIVLQPGYNMIGNPFSYTVSWANSFKSDSVEKVLWKYDGKFDTVSSVMEPFRGYFIKNRAKTSKIIRISSAQVSTASGLNKNESVESFDAQEWKIQISALTKKSFDERNYIGMMQKAADGFDDADLSEPPVAPSDYLSLAIRNKGERLAADYRPITREGQYWDINLSSGVSNIPIVLSLQTYGNLASDFRIYILDKKQERVYDATQSLSHSITLDKKEYSRELRILVGTQQFVESNTNGVPIVPLEFSLSQNYPNPFNPTTSLKYSLSNSAKVKLEIYNTLGQKVKMLVQESQPIGTYLVNWDATNDDKKTVASGVYYYRLQANPHNGGQSFVSVKKMTLIK